MQAMILAAGLGTRLRPLTNYQPKALVKVDETPLLEIVINKLIAHGVDELIINVHHFAGQIVDFLKSKEHFGLKIHISDERDGVLETGGGLKHAQAFFHNEPFLLCNTDILSNIDLTQLYETHLNSDALVTLATRHRSTSRYLIFDDKNVLHGWTNIKTGSLKMRRPVKGDLQLRAFSGIHVIDPKIFSLMSRTGKFSIIDTYLDLASDHRICSYDHDNDLWLDVGKPEHLAQAKGLLDQMI